MRIKEASKLKLASPKFSIFAREEKTSIMEKFITDGVPPFLKYAFRLVTGASNVHPLLKNVLKYFVTGEECENIFMTFVQEHKDLKETAQKCALEAIRYRRVRDETKTEMLEAIKQTVKDIQLHQLPLKIQKLLTTIAPWIGSTPEEILVKLKELIQRDDMAPKFTSMLAKMFGKMLPKRMITKTIGNTIRIIKVWKKFQSSVPPQDAAKCDTNHKLEFEKSLSKSILYAFMNIPLEELNKMIQRIKRDDQSLLESLLDEIEVFTFNPVIWQLLSKSIAEKLAGKFPIPKATICDAFVKVEQKYDDSFIGDNASSSDFADSQFESGDSSQDLLDFEDNSIERESAASRRRLSRRRALLIMKRLAKSEKQPPP